MANYLARVELHDRTSRADYEKLHDAMAAKGFAKAVKSGPMPTGTYWRSSDTGLASAKNDAMSAANTVTKDNSIFIVEFTNWDHYNLH